MPRVVAARDSAASAMIEAAIQRVWPCTNNVAFNYSAEGAGDETGRQPTSAQRARPTCSNVKNGWIALFVTQTHWPLLLKNWPDHDPALDDPKWINSNLRRQHADYINAQVTSFTSRFLKEDLAELMQKNGIPGLPVNSPSDFMKDPQIKARGFFGDVTHPRCLAPSRSRAGFYDRRAAGWSFAGAAFGTGIIGSVLR